MIAVTIGALAVGAWVPAAHACKTEKSTRTTAVTALARKGGLHIEQRDSHPGFAYALVRENGRWIHSLGEARDLRIAMAAHEKQPGDMLWFRLGTTQYVTRDQEILDQAVEAFDTQNELSDAVTNLADLQSQLTDEQARLADRAAALSDRQASFADRLSDLAIRISAVRDAKLRLALHQKIDELREGLTELVPMQQVLASQQRLLAQRVADLAAQQRQLQVSKAEFIEGIEDSMEAMLAEAVENGQAERN
jgi:hypothetical protein